MQYEKLNPSGVAIAMGATWGLTIFLVGMVHHITGFGSDFMESIDSLYPGIGVGLQGILLALIFGIVHAALSGALIAIIYNAYLTTIHK